MLCEDQLPLDWLKNDKVAIEKIGKDALLEYMIERRQRKNLWNARKAGAWAQGQRSWKEGGCAFHEHGVSGPCRAHPTAT